MNFLDNSIDILRMRASEAIERRIKVEFLFNI